MGTISLGHLIEIEGEPYGLYGKLICKCFMCLSELFLKFVKVSLEFLVSLFSACLRASTTFLSRPCLQLRSDFIRKIQNDLNVLIAFSRFTLHDDHRMVFHVLHSAIYYVVEESSSLILQIPYWNKKNT